MTKNIPGITNFTYKRGLNGSCSTKPRTWFIHSLLFLTLVCFPFWRFLGNGCSLTERRRAENRVEIYFRYKYRWLIVTTNTLCGFEWRGRLIYLGKAERRKRARGSRAHNRGDQSAKRFIEILEFVPQIRWNLVYGIYGMRSLFFLSEKNLCFGETL